MGDNDLPCRVWEGGTKSVDCRPVIEAWADFDGQSERLTDALPDCVIPPRPIDEVFWCDEHNDVLSHLSGGGGPTCPPPLRRVSLRGPPDAYLPGRVFDCPGPPTDERVIESV
ncbi:hypothetical protein A3C23_03940 [Candidatus Roizmanbacteria bacterium RIFCSPHIGHO2_02_FULL_37_13b]|uniref:Uncharacterized protein n=1 Tax=Candidatus Roizmanbacteria bacterium RIFCSPLOWO2_02_FULL_36_11 TaxID=1802071 RepID=A0A1F7JC51_9BACT|nr:MAG: hypothetical protein A3C23_03940 [Candidatus Roizmanbacteria bacterium RIFCSPHIGHO2_02_FULL_37_13b]OGK53180.1 MAG: hypothetical protein A3H78_06240 [Candidatus Roizmanbacteria bacterium RIFCSPLOWO2_02_FULL_36_11]